MLFLGKRQVHDAKNVCFPGLTGVFKGAHFPLCYADMDQIMTWSRRAIPSWNLQPWIRAKRGGAVELQSLKYFPVDCHDLVISTLMNRSVIYLLSVPKTVASVSKNSDINVARTFAQPFVHHRREM